jgi:choline-glycine betaine transporter
MNPNWNITVISITILLSVMLSIFVLSDPDSTSKILLNIYAKLSKSFEEIFIYGGAFLLIFI